MQGCRPAVEPNVLGAIVAWCFVMLTAFWVPLALLVYWVWTR